MQCPSTSASGTCLNTPCTDLLLSCPCAQALRKRLLARKHFVPWGASKPFVHPALSAAAQQHGSLLQQQQQPLQPEPPETLPPGIEPLILWEPSEPAAAAAAGADGSETAAAAATAGGGAAVGQGGGERAIEVDPMLTRWLRPHQREGVQFMFDCVCGLRLAGGQGGLGSGSSSVCVQSRCWFVWQGGRGCQQ